MAAVRTYLRLRPEDRGRKVVEVLDATRVAVEDPQEGDFEAVFDGVFDESSTQEEVFVTCCSDVGQQLLKGFSHALIAYGAARSGKTHTVHGLACQVTESIFDSILQQSDSAVEYTVRCSVVEVYLERIRDLLVESNHVQVGGDGRLLGCARRSCLNGPDVVQTLQRANAVRMASATDPTRDSSRSSLVMELCIEQYDRRSEVSRTSSLLLCDMMASEIATHENDDKSVTTLTSQSIQALQALAREQANGVPASCSTTSPVLTQLISPCLGGNKYTSVFLTASSSNLNLRATVNTIRFGSDCRKVTNHPSAGVIERWQDCHERVQQVEEQMKLCETFARALGTECKRLSGETGKSRLKRSLEVMIEKMLECDTETRPLRFNIESKSDHQIRSEQMRLRSEARRAQTERNTAVSKQVQLRSDLAILQSENSSLKQKLSEVQEELMVARKEGVILAQRTEEVEQNLRTSQFRENEAIVFLRQLRRFYYRLLKKTSTESSGGIEKLMKIPGAPDLTQLADIDQFMFDSGLLENDEIGRDVSLNSTPTPEALVRSAHALESCAVGETGPRVVTLNPPIPQSAVKRDEPPTTAEARQRLYATPSGRCVEMRERILEEELLAMSERCIQLQNSLEAEKANLEALRDKGGMAGAFDRMRVASEAKALRDLLQKKDNDIKILVSKMNELHVSGKASKIESSNKDHHISYLEKTLEDLQKKNCMLTSDRAGEEARQMADIKRLRETVETLTAPIWRRSEEATASAQSTLYRTVIPFNVPKDDCDDPQRRVSAGGVASWVRLDLMPLTRGAGDESRSEEMKRDSVSSKIDIAIQTDPIEFELPVEVSQSAQLNIIDNCLFMDDSSETAGSVGGSNVVEAKEVVPGKLHTDSNHATNFRENGQSSQNVEASRIHFVDRMKDAPSAIDQVATRSPPETKKEGISPGETSLTRSKVEKETAECDETTKPQNSMSASSEDTKSPYKQKVSSSAEPASAPKSSENIGDAAKTEVAPVEDDNPYSRQLNQRGTDWRSRVSDKPRDFSFGGRFTSSTSKPAPGVALSNFLSRKNSEDTQDAEEDEKTTTPEFMKLFQRIGSRNQGESVIEASGCAPAKAPPRTGYSDFLRQNSQHRLQEDDSSSYGLKPWTPKKKKDEDDSSSSDDSFARSFMAGSGIPTGQKPVESSESSDEAENIGGSENPVDGKAPEDNVGDNITHKTEQEPSAPVSPASRARTLFGSQQTLVPPQDTTYNSVSTPTKDITSTISPGTESEAQVSVSARAKALFGSNGAAPPPPPPSQYQQSYNSTTRLSSRSTEKEDSDSSSNEEDETRPYFATPNKKMDSDSDSDDDSSDEEKPTKPQQGPAGNTLPTSSRSADSDSDSDSTEEGIARPSFSTPTASMKKADSDSDNDDSSDEESSSHRLPQAAAALPGKTRDDSDSDDESNADEKLGPKPEASTSIFPGTKKRGESDSDSGSSDSGYSRQRGGAAQRTVLPGTNKHTNADSDSDSSDEGTVSRPGTIKSPSLPARSSTGSDDSDDSSESEDEEVPRSSAQRFLAAKRDDSESESSSSEEETGTAGPVMSKPPPPATKVQPDSDSDSSDEGEKPVTASQPYTPFKKDDSDSNEESSDDEESISLPLKVSPRTTAANLKQSIDDSDSDSDSDDSEDEKVKAVATENGVDSGSETGDSSTGSEENEVNPPPKHQANRTDSDSDSDSSDEEEASPKGAQTKPSPSPIQAVGSRPTQLQSQDGDDTSSEGSSDAESVHKTPSPKVGGRSMSKPQDDDSEGSSSEDDSPVRISKQPQTSAFGPKSPTFSTVTPAGGNNSKSNLGGSKLGMFLSNDESSSSEEESESEGEPSNSLASESKTEGESTWADHSESLSFTTSTYNKISEFGAGGKPVGYKPKRGVEDFGSKVKPAVSSSASGRSRNSKGPQFAIKEGKLVKGSETSNEKEKQATNFAIKGGKLVKSNELSAGSRKKKEGQSKFVIREGVLVKDDTAVTPAGRHSKAKQPTGRTSSQGFEILDPQKSQSDLMNSISDGSWGQDASPQKTKRSSANFVIKNGKLTKEAATEGTPKKKKSAFQILGGKLMKSSPSGKPSPVKSAKKSSSESRNKKKPETDKSGSSSNKKKPNSSNTGSRKKPSSGTSRRPKSRTSK